ncbi:hypothetical protein PS663_01971 [Pseudomonas fluorescens]|nr:hypothetical protein PS663_01971 [Pseudomonas fluorescens]
MEKYTPHYDLAVSDHRVWQDVYCTHSKERDIYIKVTYSPDSAPPVISFKEKNP